MNKFLIILCLFATLLAMSLSAQNSEDGNLLSEEWRRSLLDKPYAEARDSLSNFLNRIEAAHYSEEQETAAWNSLKDYAVRHRDKRLEQIVDFYFIHIYRYKYAHPNGKKTIELYLELADRAKKIRHVEMQITCLHSLADRYFESENYEAGFAVYKEIEPLLESLADEAYPGKVDVYYAMGRIFYQFREYETAVVHLTNAIRLPASPRHSRVRANALNTLGLCYDSMNLPDSAEACFRTVIDEETRHAGAESAKAMKTWSFIAKKNLADIRIKRGEYENTIETYRAVIEFMSTIRNEQGFTLGTQIALAIAQIKQGNAAGAKTLFDTCLKRENIDGNHLAGWYEAKARYYTGTEQHAQAAIYKDSLLLARQAHNDRFNAMHLLRIEQHQNALNMQRKNEQLAQSEGWTQKFRNYLCLALAGCFLLAVTLGIWIHRNRRIAKKNRSLYRQIQDLTQKEKVAEQQLLDAPEEELSRTMQLFRNLSELMQKEKPFTDPDLKRKKLADRLHTNETYLADAIREATGETFSAYLSGLRLQYTLELLNEHPGMAIDAVALDSGHGSYVSFFRSFTKKYGVTPSEYRRIAASKKKTLSARPTL
ncbi:MAG: helix-turn-helix domain-containing protein [Tannerella sp.]|nr:helix-turn-helix domain-containing protein [Tannerella sp.]